MFENNIFRLYRQLLVKYRKPEEYWPQWCASHKTLQDREIICIGAILVQRTSWRNADLALMNLREERLLSLKDISNLKDFEKFRQLLRPAGFFQTKPRRLFGFCQYTINNYGNLIDFSKVGLAKAREELLNLYGIGEETADSILLYGLDKPTFIIDEYTRRFVKKNSISNKLDYKYLKNLFENNLPNNAKIYQSYHTLIIVDQKGEEGSFMRKI